MTMKNPPHPGEIIRELCLEPLGLTVTQAAQGLGVTRKTLSLLVNGHAGISPEMAVRLSQAFGRSPESWLQLQVQYDLAQVRKSAKEINLKPLYTPAGRQSGLEGLSARGVIQIRETAGPLLAQSGPADRCTECPLLGGKADVSHGVFYEYMP